MTQGTMIETNHHEIRASDILCSKDKSLLSHPGNRLFRKIIHDAKPSYRLAPDKATKMKITKNVLNCLSKDHGCRFFKFDPDLAAWAELTPAQMRDKIGHALRFALRRNNHGPLSSEVSLDSSGSRSSVTKRTKTVNRLPKVVSIPSQATLKRTTVISNEVSDILRTTESHPTRTQRREDFQAGEELHAGLSISMERIQRARHDVDQIIQRQNEFLLTLTRELSVITNVPPSAAEIGTTSSQSRSVLSHPFDLDLATIAPTLEELDFLFEGVDAN